MRYVGVARLTVIEFVGIIPLYTLFTSMTFVIKVNIVSTACNFEVIVAIIRINESFNIYIK
jgi:hypothetical protein